MPLGVLPLGTLNHFAKDLGIPEKLEDAVALITAGHTRRVDLGEVNGEIFINNSSLGIYPYLVSDRERQTSATGRTKWVAASLAFLRVLRRFPDPAADAGAWRRRGARPDALSFHRKQ